MGRSRSIEREINTEITHPLLIINEAAVDDDIVNYCSVRLAEGDVVIPRSTFTWVQKRNTKKGIDRTTARSAPCFSKVRREINYRAVSLAKLGFGVDCVRQQIGSFFILNSANASQESRLRWEC